MGVALKGLQPLFVVGCSSGKAAEKVGPMRSAAECISKAEELSEIADSIFDADARTLVLTLAELWLDLSEQAQWQDSSSPVRAYRVQ
jgi:hypothetical protein